MKKERIVAVGVGVLGAYLLGCFYSAGFDIRMWEPDARFGCALLMGSVALIAAVFPGSGG